MNNNSRRIALFVVIALAGIARLAGAQVATGAITGVISDSSGGVLPGVAVTLSGERLLGGSQTLTTDAAGQYRFDRLSPGVFELRFELAGFKSVDRPGIRINAGFTATVNLRMEMGQVEETVVVSGASPTVDTKSAVQQTIMGQEVLEGIPTGRDPWALGKIIPGVQVSTYDVGGTQGMQQSSMSARGSTSGDVTYAIDGLNVNWPGGSGGAAAMYYDQGMFEEINYQTAALPAEVVVGGIFVNMVTKDGGNQLRGDFKLFGSSRSLQSENHKTEELEKFNFAGGNPVTALLDLNLSAGGPLRKDRLWWHVSARNWKVDRELVGSKNPDGSPAVDDNLIRNISGKLSWQITKNYRLGYIYNFDQKSRYHRREATPAFVPDVATQRQLTEHVQTGPKLTAVLGTGVVFESGFSYRNGQGEFGYQKEVPPGAIRIEDSVRNSADVAGPNSQLRPNGRTQFDNSVAWHVTDLAGSHLFKLGVQWARQSFETRDEVSGDLYKILRDGVPNSVRIFNTPTQALSYTRQTGFYAQDSWSLGSVTFNIGGRFDTMRGWWPEHNVPAGRFIGARHLDAKTVVKQNIATWRSGVIYDVGGKGKTAIKLSVSRYATQVGIDRVTNVHPLVNASGTRAWTDLNGDREPQDNELGTFSGFAEAFTRYADPNGPDWPFSDEITAGIERELVGDLRVGLMYYHRANRKQVDRRNAAVPTSAYTQQSVSVPGTPTGPGGTATFFNLLPAYLGQQDNAWDNEALLDNDYDGVELTLSKRLSNRWQAFGGLTFGKNYGGIATGELNDPNNLVNQQGIVGMDSKYSFKLSGSYAAPWDITISASLLHNNGYPYQSTYSVTRTVFPALTRASQLVRLTESGTERLPDVTMLDLRLSRPFRFGGKRQVVPLLELFNLTNASTVVRLTPAVGSLYLAPSEILGPRLIRLGLRVEF